MDATSSAASASAARFEQLPQRGAGRHARAEIDDAIVLDGSEGGAAVDDEREQLHWMILEACWVRPRTARGLRRDGGDEPVEFGIVTGSTADVAVGRTKRGGDTVLAKPGPMPSASPAVRTLIPACESEALDGSAGRVFDEQDTGL